MNAYKFTATLSIIYVAGLTLIFLFDEPLIHVGVIVALALYHASTYFRSLERLQKEREVEKKALLSSLNQSEAKTSEAKTQFYSLIEELGSGVLFLDAWGIIQIANNDFHQWFDYDDPIKNHFEIFKKDKPLYDTIKKATESQSRIREQIHLDEAKITLDIVVSPILEEGTYYGSLVLIHDVSQLKTAENFQKQFTADVSHELRTPLSAIKGISEILTRDSKMSHTKQKEFLDMIKHEAGRLDVILNDLLIISKMDRLDYELKIEDASVHQIVKESIDLLKPEADKKNLSLNFNVDDRVFPFDPSKMRQVIINLIKNAINYTDSGYIDIKGSIQDGFYRIDVTDTGIGIAKKHQERIFKRFFRVDDDRSRDTGGSGLGLSIIKNVVKKHGGEIALESALGKGSTFTIKLPIMERNDPDEQ
ncbi:MAG: sensor histidine kinase [Candidatus Izemoplasmataceae bacterium]